MEWNCRIEYCKAVSAKLLVDLQKILVAYFTCRNNKRKTANALLFELNLERNISSLYKELLNGSYFPGRSVCFVVTHPKIREIFAAEFRDRVVHHLLINEIELHFERRFIYDSFACRKNKGCHEAIARLKNFINRITVNKTKNAYFLQLDIKSFFPTIDKNILYKIMEREIHHPKILWLAKLIIFHDPTQNFYFKGARELLQQIPPHKSLFFAPKNIGLPIGNLTSQFFANVYLNELDQFVKRTLKAKFYIRYVDDIVLLSDNPMQLTKWREQIDDFLKNILQLELHPDKDKTGSVYQGIDFLGYVVKPSYVLTRKRVVDNLKTKLYCFNKNNFLIEKISGEKIKLMQSMVNSYYGHFSHANCSRLRKNIYENHFGILKKYLVPTKGYTCFHYVKSK